MHTAATQRLTLEEYASLDEPENQWITELVRGLVVREPRPGSLHGRVQVELGRILGNWARESRRGLVVAESGFILSDDPATLRGPDIAVVLDGRSGEGQPGGWIRGAPDVAVEVLSPSDTSSGVMEKVLEYLEAGAKLVWIVDAQARSVTVYRPDRSASLLRGGDTLLGEDVLAGFTIALGDLFEG